MFLGGDTGAVAPSCQRNAAAPLSRRLSRRHEASMTAPPVAPRRFHAGGARGAMAARDVTDTVHPHDTKLNG